jgi:transcriptional regulator with XRE-family HTH domain
MTKVPFKTWLQSEMSQRNWRPADLVEATELDSAVISNLLSGSRNAGVVTCKAIASGLRIPLTVVYQAAGLLDEDPARDPVTDKIAHAVLDLDSDDKMEVLDYVRLKLKRAHQKMDHQGANKRAPRGVAST